MSFSKFKFILDKIKSETNQYSVLTFAGMGEPLLDNSLTKKINYAKKLGFYVIVLTNASMLSVNRFRDLKKSVVDNIRISLFGNTSKSFMSMHGLNNKFLFGKIKKNISEILKIRKNVKIILTYNVLYGINEKTLKEWIAYWKNKVDLIEVWKPHNWIYAKDYRVLQKSRLKTCGRPFMGPLQVQVDGTVNMCCFDFNGKLFLGDMRNMSLKEIFSSSNYNYIRRTHTLGFIDKSKLICRKCDQLNKNKKNIMIYNSRFDISKRVLCLSTTYRSIINNVK